MWMISSRSSGLTARVLVRDGAFADRAWCDVERSYRYRGPHLLSMGQPRRNPDQSARRHQRPSILRVDLELPANREGELVPVVRVFGRLVVESVPDRLRTNPCRAIRKVDLTHTRRGLSLLRKRVNPIGFDASDMASISHFAINADDVERARRFYEKVFGWKSTPWGPPGFYQLETPEGSARGALQTRRELLPNTPMVGFECTFSVEDLAAVERVIKSEGGEVVLPRSVIARVGYLAFFRDTEGNVFGAMQYDPSAA